MNYLSLGITGILLSLAFLGLVFALVRFTPKAQEGRFKPLNLPAPPGIDPVTDAVLVVQVGGRVVYTNQLAREWFGLLEEEPGLERLARRARPSEIFLGLCANEGQARFSLNGRFVEGTSFYIPYDGSGATLVSLHRPQVTALGSGEGDSAILLEQAVDIFSELSQAMTASLDVEATLRAIMESVERLIPSDFPEIALWNAEKEVLIPYRFVGLPGLDRRLEKAEDCYPPTGGYIGRLIETHAPLLINDIDNYREVRPLVDRKQYPFNAYLGAPLFVANELVGILGLASISKNAFSQNDLEVLRILSGQAAVALHNAILYQEEQRRVVELSGLAQLAHAVGAINDPEDLFTRLTESIKPLLEVEVLGFWLFDEAQHRLDAQAPFLGLPSEVIELYHLNIVPDSEAEALLSKQETIVSTNAPEDSRLQALDLGYRMQAAGILHTVFEPLNSGGRLLGYLQVGDRLDNQPFDHDDLRMLSIIATQAAIIIENATLVQQTQRRALRAEALRRIASLIGSSATLDETLQFSLRELARLLQADSGVILLIDEARGELRLHKTSLFNISAPALQALGRFAIDITRSQFKEIKGNGGMPSFLTGRAAEDPGLSKAYQPLIKALQAESLIAVPLTVRDRCIGEMLVTTHQENFFDQSDAITIHTAAGQLAAAIDQASLSTQTDESLRRRVDQLTALTRISRELNTSLDLEYLLQKVFNEVVTTTQASCGSILFFEPWQSGSPISNIILQIGDQHGEDLTVLERQVLEQEEPLLIKDFAQLLESEDRPDLHPPHTGVRSMLIVPIAFQEQITGLINLHSGEAGKFDETAVEIAQTLAIQAAIAIGNAQRYREQFQRSELLNRRVDTLAKLLETTQSLHLDQPLEESLEAIAYGIQESTPFNIVLISVLQPEGQQLRRVAGAGLTLDQMADARAHRQPWSSVEKFLQPEFRIGNAYFIPGDKAPANPPELHFLYSGFAEQRSNGDSSWDSEDLILIPLLGASGNPVGLISIDDPRNGRRPDRPSIEGVEIFATQAAMLIEGYQKLNELKAKTHQMQRDVERSLAAREQAQKNIPTLLQKDLQQTVSIQVLSQRVKRIRAGLDIAEIVNHQPNRLQVLYAVGKEMLTRMDLDIALVAEPSTGGLRLLDSFGSLPPNANPEALLGQRNPLRHSLQTGENVFAANTEDHPEWRSSPLLQSLDARSFICLAISGDETGIDQNVEASILALSHTPLPVFTAEDEQLYALLSRQVSVALQNLRLLNETSRRLQEVNLLLDFTRQLGSLDPVNILRTLADSALKVIPSADTCMVALWDPEEGKLIPQAASGYPKNERVLEIQYLSGEALPGQSFEKCQPICLNEVDFARHYNLSSENLLRYRDATAGRLPVSTLVVPIARSIRIEKSEEEAVGVPTNALGVLVLDSFKIPAAFSSEDQALIASLAQQTALTLENARLYQASEQRALQLQTLTKLAATITSSLQSDELITSLLDQAKAIIAYDTGTLWLRQGEQLTIHTARGFEDSEERVGLSVAVEDSLLLKEMIGTGQAIYVEDVRNDERFPAFIEHTYLSWLGIPLISKGEVVGVIALEKTEPDYYSPEHIQAITTFAGQAAVALENARLYEDSVKRAMEMDQRSKRLALLNRLSTALGSSLDPTYILKLTTQELHLATNSTAVSAILFNPVGTALLQAESSANKSEEELPVTLPDAPLFERLRESMGVFNTEDIYDSQGQVLSLLTPLSEFLTARSTRGLLVLPLSTGSDMHGLLFIHNEEPYRFSTDEVELARTISNQAAVAVQNARLFAETQLLYAETEQHSHELGALFEMGVSLSQMLQPSNLIDIVFENLTSLLHINSIGLMLKEETEKLSAQIIERGEKIGPILLEPNGQSLSEYVMSTAQPQIFSDIQRDRDQLPVPGYTVGDPVRSWLGMPLVVRGNTIGVLSVQSDEADKFSEKHLRLVGQVANQLAVAFDNARLFSTVQSYAADLEKRVAERTKQLAREHKRIQTLLGIITELSTSLDMDIVLSRTLVLINETIGSEHSTIMLGQPDSPNLFIRASEGYIGSSFPTPKGGQVSNLKYNEGLAGWIIANREAVMINDLQEDDRWERHEDQTSLHRSAIAVPLLLGEEVLGALMLFHRQPDQFFPDQMELVQAAAKQIAVSINNAQLFGLIRDQAERLGDMLRRQHIETSRSQAILEAVADGVLVTDANREITLFNASAERILDLKRQQVLGRTLEHFTGLFGKAAHTWVETIRTWSSDPSSFESGDVYSEQIELDGGRVVSVHLSPVRLRNDFLGTVSIFRDITHLIEVDRLKSEFVATVSHELRTPMTSIKGYVEILLMGAAGELSHQQEHFLEIVKANTERLAILVNDLLDVSKIEAGKVTLSMQPLDLREMASQAAAELKRRTEEDSKPMDIQVHFPDRLSRVIGDPERVRQVIDNLLENAYYYTPEHGCITVTIHDLERHIQIDIKDNGIGILPEDQKRIFERFYRGEDPLVLATSGTGLGLSIVQRLIDMHQGRLWLESSGVPGEGSTFSFTLPKK